MRNNQMDMRAKILTFISVAFLVAVGQILSREFYELINVHSLLGRLVSSQTFRVGILVIICLTLLFIVFLVFRKIFVHDYKRFGLTQQFLLRLFAYGFILSVLINLAYRFSWAVYMEIFYGTLLH